MKADEYFSTVKALGMSLAAAARFFNANEKTSRRWAKEEFGQSVPRSVSIALRLMQKHGETPQTVDAMMDERDAAK